MLFPLAVRLHAVRVNHHPVPLSSQSRLGPYTQTSRHLLGCRPRTVGIFLFGSLRTSQGPRLALSSKSAPSRRGSVPSPLLSTMATFRMDSRHSPDRRTAKYRRSAQRCNEV